MIRQGSGWVLEGDAGSPSYTPGGSAYTPGGGSPYAGSYAGTPHTGGFASPGSYAGSPGITVNSPGSAFGPPPGPPRTPSLNVSSPGPYGVTSPNVYGASYTPASQSHSSFPTGATLGSPMPQSSAPGTPMYGHFPPTPNTAAGNGSGFPRSPAPGAGFGHPSTPIGLGFAPSSPGPGSPGPPPRRGSAQSGKKDD